MGMYITLSIAAALAATAIGLSSPAAATDLKGALAICNKTGSCQVNGGKGGANIKYNGNEIWCPYGGGKCECLACSPPKRTETGGTGPKAGGGVLSGGATGGKPAPKGAGGSTGPKVGGKPVAVQKTSGPFMAATAGRR